MKDWLVKSLALSNKEPISDRALRWLWLGVLVLVGFLLVAFIIQIFKDIGQPYSYDYGEAWNIWVGENSPSGIYFQIGEPTYVQTPYTPIFYLVTGVLYKVFGPSFLVGRLVSLFAGIGSGIFCGLIVKEVTKSKWFGLLGGCLFLVPPINRAWPLFIHVDCLGMFFSLMGTYIVVKYLNTRKMLWAVIPYLLALFTKQIFITAPLAVIIYLLLTKKWKLNAQFIGLMTVGGVALIGLFQWLSGGLFVEAIFFFPTVYHRIFWIAIYLNSVNIIGQWLILLLALCAVLITFMRRKELPNPVKFIAVYFVVTSVVSFILSAKIGAWMSYFMEQMTVAILLVPIFAWEASKLKISRKLPRTGIIWREKSWSTELKASTLLAFIIPLALILQVSILPSFSSWTNVTQDSKDSFAVALEDLKSVPLDSPVICEDAGLLRDSGRLPPLVEPNFFSQSIRYGKLDPTRIYGMIERREFALIIQEWDVNGYWNWEYETRGMPKWVPAEVRKVYTMAWLRSTEEEAILIRDNYQLKHKTTRFWIYEPKTS